MIKVKSKEELGTLSGLQRSTTVIAIINEGEAKNQLKELLSNMTK